MSAPQTCALCGREGVRGYGQDGEGRTVCVGQSAGACAERREKARLAVGLHRFERVGSDGETYHTYKLDGQRVPGATSVIGATVPKKALVDWAARVTARYAADNLDTLWGMRHLGLDRVYDLLWTEPRKQRDSAGARGSQLHLWAEELATRGTVAGITDELMPWVMAVRDFIEDCRPVPVLQEAPVASRRWGYAGTLDLVADFPEIRTAGRTFPAARRIVDYKSSRGVYGEVALQLGAYRNAEFYKLPGDEREHSLAELGIADEGFVVHVRPEGYQLVPVYCGDETIQLFSRLVWVREQIRRNGPMDNWVGDPLPVINERNRA